MQKGEGVGRETTLLVLMAAVVAVAYVLIAPIPEMDATEFRQIALVVVLSATCGSLFRKTLVPIFAVQRRVGESPLLKEALDILAVLDESSWDPSREFLKAAGFGANGSDFGKLREPANLRLYPLK